MTIEECCIDCVVGLDMIDEVNVWIVDCSAIYAGCSWLSGAFAALYYFSIVHNFTVKAKKVVLFMQWSLKRCRLRLSLNTMVYFLYNRYDYTAAS